MLKSAIFSCFPYTLYRKRLKITFCLLPTCSTPQRKLTFAGELSLTIKMICWNFGDGNIFSKLKWHDSQGCASDRYKGQSKSFQFVIDFGARFSLRPTRRKIVSWFVPRLFISRDHVILPILEIPFNSRACLSLNESWGSWVMNFYSIGVDKTFKEETHLFTVSRW